MNPALIAAILGQVIPLSIRMYEALQPMNEEEQEAWIAKLQNDIDSILPRLGEIRREGSVWY